jgi:hypothetical protein
MIILSYVTVALHFIKTQSITTKARDATQKKNFHKKSLTVVSDL